MAVGLKAPESLLPVKGVRLASMHCGIKGDKEADDLVLIELAKGTSTAAVFTRNKFCAAPVTVAREHLGSAGARYLLINSGNANAGTGKTGLSNARKSCEGLAELGSVDVDEVLPFSTGVIGTQLPLEKITAALPGLFDRLSEDNWLAAARGIMTTDTLPKAISRQVMIGDETITITGICKGSGMIRPDMATMLAYVATDAKISPDALQDCLNQVAKTSFNSITVDGDTSTNDACLLMATGTSHITVDMHHEAFMGALEDVFRHLAQAIIRDGEGATKFVEIHVQHAANDDDARELAYTIAHSPLVKTALFASDANWGRILAAVGRAQVSSLDIERVDLYLGDVCLIENGLPHAGYSEEKGAAVMQQQDIVITVNLNLARGEATIWTTDLSYDYVKINAEYRS